MSDDQWTEHDIDGKSTLHAIELEVDEDSFLGQVAAEIARRNKERDTAKGIEPSLQALANEAAAKVAPDLAPPKVSAWTSNNPGEYRFDFDQSNGITLVHNGDVSRAHMFVSPTFWRTDNGNMSANVRADVLAIPPEHMQREALICARNALRAALDKVEARLTDGRA